MDLFPNRGHLLLQVPGLNMYTYTWVLKYATMWRHILFFQLPHFPKDFVHKISCGAPMSLECPYGVLVFSLFCFVHGLHKVVEMKAHTQPYTQACIRLRPWTSYCLSFCILNFCFASAPTGFVHVFTLWTFPEPWSFFVIGSRFECVYLLKHTPSPLTQNTYTPP